MLSPSPGISAAFGSDRTENFDAFTGMIAVSPAGVDSKMTWPSVRENIVVAIPPDSMLDLAGHELDCVDFELRPTNRTLDQNALHVARLIKAELADQGLSTELYIDSLVTVLGIHVLRNYSSITKPTHVKKTGLSVHVADRVRDYIQENLARKLSVSELAGICNLSRGHFIQSFTKTFGVPPHRYLLARRLEFAERLLQETDIPIREVAVLSGFSSQSHFTGTMKMHRQNTPSQLR
jgi:AraC family transcriptional regulator